MIYPKFIKKGETIGITAGSAGVRNKIESDEKAIRSLSNEGYNIIETSNVRVNNKISSDKKIRAEELKKLYKDNRVKLIMCASGGDFCYEMLPYIDCEIIKNNLKWIVGYSDPTSILYMITTNLDIATIYGVNAGSFDQSKLHKSLENNLKIIQGNLIKQESFDLYELNRDENIDGYNLTEKVIWNNINGNFNVKGRCIGGCLDVIKNIIGTPYDGTKKFIDGFVWYFDIFALRSEEVYLTLLQMKYAGYFKYCKAVLVGRVLFPNSFIDMSYEEALKKVFIDIPVCMNMDIGHVAPKMTLINGAIINVESIDGKGNIKFELK